ncbi:unnamed protein product, partial [Didymodactylos carnosus]
NEDTREHEKSLHDLEQRWHNLHALILSNEKNIEITAYTKKFNDELNTLEKIRQEYEHWLDSTNENDITQTTNAQNEIIKIRISTTYSGQ